MTTTPRPRDWWADIQAAAAAATGVRREGDLPARVAVDTGADGLQRAIRFEHAGESAVEWLGFTGSVGELAADSAAPFVLRVGLGPAGAPWALRVERARAAAVVAAKRLTAGAVRIEAPPGLTGTVVDGLADACDVDGVRLIVAAPELEAARSGLLAAQVGRLARLLISAPANVLYPERLAELAVDIADRLDLEATVLTPGELNAQGFGAITAIGQGSVNGPRLVRLRYVARSDAATVGLVGKGITFDSGGLSLKSPAAMQSMRLDVAGAATVLAAVAGLRRIRCPVNVVAVLPLAENLPGPGATRPGDVVTAWNDMQIQILDTDFEGRVVLADGLAWAAADRPDLLVDLATLTYQAEIALGPEIAAVLGRGGGVERLLSAAGRAGEPMWPLPLDERYLDQVRTSFGVRNHPLHDSGRAITAALFLAEFVPGSVPWAHCDMTGPAWTGNASVDGATGFGVRTLLELLDGYRAEASSDPTVV